jgi:hypothetical protein
MEYESNRSPPYSTSFAPHRLHRITMTGRCEKSVDRSGFLLPSSVRCQAFFACGWGATREIVLIGHILLPRRFLKRERDYMGDAAREPLRRRGSASD